MASVSVEDNKLLVLRLYDDLLNRGRLGLAAELIAADFVDHGAPPGAPSGPAGLCAFVRALRVAFPDGRHVLEDLIAEDDLVAVRLTFVGTHTGPLVARPTGRRVAEPQIHIVRVADGKGIERWMASHDMALRGYDHGLPRHTINGDHSQ